MSIIRTALLCLFVGVPWVASLHAEPLQVAVAANFTAPMRELAERFEAETGYPLALSFASSGKFFAQITHGAPYAVFFSADQSTPKMLERQGLAVSGSRITYAIGTLTLWSSHDALVDSQGKVLKQGQFRKLALANPRLAPYGVAAVETLTAMGLVESTRDRWVMGENISQAFQFVYSGAAPLGLVALSQVRAETASGKGSAWVVPEHLHAPIRQDAVLLRPAENNPVARKLLEYVQGSAARGLIEAYGYRLPAQ